MRIWWALVVVTACWHGSGPPPAGGHDTSSPPAALGPSPCARLAVHEMATAGAPRVPPPPEGGRILDPAFSGLVAGRFVVVFAGASVTSYVYDLGADRWSHFDGAGGPTSASWIRAFAAGDRVVLAWSSDDPEQLLHLAAVDVTRGEIRAMPVGGAPPRLDGIVDAVAGGLVAWPVGAGGIDFAHGARFDFTRWTWQRVPERGAPSARGAASHVVAGDRVFVWGGEAAHHALRDGAVLDATRMEWTPIDPSTAPLARMKAPAFAWRDRVLVWGGELPYDGTPHDLADAWIYDLGSRTWRAANAGAPPHIPSSAAGHETRGTGRFAAIVPDGTADLGPGAVFDFTRERWDALPDLPPSAHPPAAGRPRWFVQLGERAVGWIGSQGSLPLVVLDLADRAWCTPDVQGAKVLASPMQSLYWDGPSVGVWGALVPDMPPPCPPGAPCARFEAHWNGTPVGSVLRW